ncbi:MAG: zinc ribbon domain-containing protein [Desulfurococcaceae archaeon]
MFYSLPRAWRERNGHYLLKATKCLDCGKTLFPASNVCRACGSRNITSVNLVDEDARLLSWTAIYSPPSGLSHQKPLLIGLLETINSKVKLISRLTDALPEELSENMVMEPVLRRVSEAGDYGIINYGIAYRPKLGSRQI